MREGTIIRRKSRTAAEKTVVGMLKMLRSFLQPLSGCVSFKKGTLKLFTLRKTFKQKITERKEFYHAKIFGLRSEYFL